MELGTNTKLMQLIRQDIMGKIIPRIILPSMRGSLDPKDLFTVNVKTQRLGTSYKNMNRPIILFNIIEENYLQTLPLNKICQHLRNITLNHRLPHKTRTNFYIFVLNFLATIPPYTLTNCCTDCKNTLYSFH